MSRVINVLFIAIGLLLFCFSFVIYQTNVHVLLPLTILLSGIGLMVFAFMRDSRHEKTLKENKQVEINRRISELTKKPWLSDQALQVHRSATMPPLAISMGIISVILIKVGLTIESIPWTYLFFGFLFLVFTVITLSRFYVGISKPACEMSRNGFTIPLHGFISWKGVTGICLHEVTTRGNTSYILLFRVEDYAKIVTNIHWTDSMFGLFGLGVMKRGVIGVQLNDPKEQPEVIYSASKFLWKQATGFDYDWNPSLSDAYNESAKQLGKVFSTQSSDPKILYDRLVKNPQAMLSELETASKHQTIVANELQKASRKLRIQLWIVSAGVLIFFLVKLYFLWMKHNQ